MFKNIAVINKATVLTSGDVAKMVTACNTQVSRDVAPVWGRTTIPVRLYSSESLIPRNSAIIYLLNNADQAGALGYHTETWGGQVFGKVFAQTIMNYGLKPIYDGNNITVSSVLSHEVLELMFNPYVDLWADGPVIDTDKNEYAYEVCDPVEADIYSITVSKSPVAVSNFVYPEWFDIASPSGTKFDYLNKLTAPYTMTENGYMVVRGNSGNETAVFGSKYPLALKKMHGYIK